MVPVEVGRSVGDVANPVCFEYDKYVVVVEELDGVDSLVERVGDSLVFSGLEDCNTILLLELLFNLEVVEIDVDCTNCIDIVPVCSGEFIELGKTLCIELLRAVLYVLVRCFSVAVEVGPNEGEVAFLFCIELDKTLAFVDIFGFVDSSSEILKVSLG